LFGFGVTFVLFLSKVYGLIWLIMRDTLSVSYFGGRAGNTQVSVYCVYTRLVMIDFIVISVIVVVITHAGSLLSSPVALQDVSLVSVALFLRKCS